MISWFCSARFFSLSAKPAEIKSLSVGLSSLNAVTFGFPRFATLNINKCRVNCTSSGEGVNPCSLARVMACWRMTSIDMRCGLGLFALSPASTMPCRCANCTNLVKRLSPSFASLVGSLAVLSTNFCTVSLGVVTSMSKACILLASSPSECDNLSATEAANALIFSVGLLFFLIKSLSSIPVDI